MFTVYIYQKCCTCRDAIQWLNTHHIPHKIKAIRETPPSPEELQIALDLQGGEIRKLFNTSGMDYRSLGMKDKLPSMSNSEAIQLLSQNGNLIKRPFLIGSGKVLAGFKPEIWAKTLLK